MAKKSKQIRSKKKAKKVAAKPKPLKRKKLAKKGPRATKAPKRTALASTRMGVMAEAAGAVAEVLEAKGCLPYPDAEELVYRCGSPEADGQASSTALGKLFGGQRLNGFCQCVASGVPVSESKIPCSPSKNIQDVVDAIACK